MTPHTMTRWTVHMMRQCRTARSVVELFAVFALLAGCGPIPARPGDQGVTCPATATLLLTVTSRSGYAAACPDPLTLRYSDDPHAYTYGQFAGPWSVQDLLLTNADTQPDGCYLSGLLSDTGTFRFGSDTNYVESECTATLSLDIYFAHDGIATHSTQTGTHLTVSCQDPSLSCEATYSVSE